MAQGRKSGSSNGTQQRQRCRTGRKSNTKSSMNMRTTESESSNSTASNEHPPVTHSPDSVRCPLVSINIGTIAAGGIFDFIRYSQGSALVDGVLCTPDPRGGSPMIFMAPPPHQTTSSQSQSHLFLHPSGRSPREWPSFFLVTQTLFSLLKQGKPSYLFRALHRTRSNKTVRANARQDESSPSSVTSDTSDEVSKITNGPRQSTRLKQPHRVSILRHNLLKHSLAQQIIHPLHTRRPRVCKPRTLLIRLLHRTPHCTPHTPPLLCPHLPLKKTMQLHHQITARHSSVACMHRNCMPRRLTAHIQHRRGG